MWLCSGRATSVRTDHRCGSCTLPSRWALFRATRMVAHDADWWTGEGPGFSEHGRTSREVRASLAHKVTPTVARHNGPLTDSNPLAYHSRVDPRPRSARHG